jgi:hypothetical protein
MKIVQPYLHRETSNQATRLHALLSIHEGPRRPKKALYSSFVVVRVSREFLFERTRGIVHGDPRRAQRHMKKVLFSALRVNVDSPATF